MLFNTFKKIDLYGRNVELMIDQSERRKTFVGVLTTLIVFAAVLAYSVYTFLTELEKPYSWTISQSTLRMENDDYYNFLDDKTIGLALETYGGGTLTAKHKARDQSTLNPIEPCKASYLENFKGMQNTERGEVYNEWLYQNLV